MNRFPETMMKNQLIKSILTLAGSLALFLFIGGLFWSLQPLGERTLPQWVGASTGLPFNWAALLVSFILSLMCTGAIVLFAAIERLYKWDVRSSGF